MVIQIHRNDLLDPIRHEGAEGRKQSGDGGQNDLDPEGGRKVSLQGITGFLFFDNGGCYRNLFELCRKADERFR